MQAVGPMQLPVEWVLGLCPGLKWPGVWRRPPTPHLVQRLKKSIVIPVLTPWACMAYCKVNLTQGNLVLNRVLFELSVFS